MRYNNYRKPQLRLMTVLGWLRLFFSFNPWLILCQQCHYKKVNPADIEHIERDGGSRKDQIIAHCDGCRQKL